ncbi:MAG: PKD domain-containing protein [Actinomycetota bacterium]
MSDLSVDVSGDVTGQVAIGDGNTLIQTGAGTIVVNGAAGGRLYVERELPLLPTSRAFRGLAGRDDVVAGITEELESGGTVEVIAADGWGKTVLLRWLARNAATAAQPDGVITLSVKGLPLEDVFQELFEARHEWLVPDEQRVKASRRQVAQSMADLRALIVVDDIEDDTEVEDLLEAAAQSGWILAGRSRHLHGEGHRVRLAGLDEMAATTVLEEALDRQLTAEERPLVAGIVEAVAGRPMDLVRIGDEVADGGTTLAETLGRYRGEESAPTVDLSELSDVERRALELLSLDRPIAAELLASILGVDDGQAVLDGLAERGLLTAPASPRRLDPHVAELVRPADGPGAAEHAALDELTVWASADGRTPDEIADAAPFAVALLRRARDAGEHRRVYEGARAVEQHLPLAARFGLWAQIVELARDAAPHVGEAEEAWATNQRGVLDVGGGSRVLAWWRFRTARRTARRVGADDVAHVAHRNARFLLPLVATVAAAIAAIALLGGAAAVALWPDGEPTRGVGFVYGTEEGPPWLAEVGCEGRDTQRRGGDWGSAVDPVRIPTKQVCSIDATAADGIGGDALGRFGRQAGGGPGSFQVLVRIGEGLAGASVAIGPDQVGDREVELLAAAAPRDPVSITIEAVRLDGSDSGSATSARLTCDPAPNGTVEFYVNGPWSRAVDAGTECTVEADRSVWDDLVVVGPVVRSFRADDDLTITFEYDVPGDVAPPRGTEPPTSTSVVAEPPATTTGTTATTTPTTGTTTPTTATSTPGSTTSTTGRPPPPPSTTRPTTSTTTGPTTPTTAGPPPPSTTGPTTSTSTTTTTTSSPPPNESPTGLIDISTTRGTAPLTVQLDGRRSNDTDGSIEEYSWTVIGDGLRTISALETGSTLPYTFELPGRYEVSLVVTDDDGAPSTTATVVVIVEEPPSAIACRPELAHRSFGLAGLTAAGRVPFGGTTTGVLTVDGADSSLRLDRDGLVAPGRGVSRARLTWVQDAGPPLLAVPAAAPPTRLGTASHRSGRWDAYVLDVTDAFGDAPLEVLVANGGGSIEGGALTVVTTVAGCTETVELPTSRTTGDDGLAWVHYNSADWVCATAQPQRSERRPTASGSGPWPSSCSEVVVEVPPSAVDRTMAVVMSVAGVESQAEQDAARWCRDHELRVLVGDGAVTRLFDVFGPDELTEPGGRCHRPSPQGDGTIAAFPDLVGYPGARWASVRLEILVPAGATEIVLELVSEKALDDDPRNAVGASGLLIGEIDAVVTTSP